MQEVVFDVKNKKNTSWHTLIVQSLFKSVAQYSFARYSFWVILKPVFFLTSAVKAAKTGKYMCAKEHWKGQSLLYQPSLFNL